MKRKHLLLCAALIVSASFAKADETNAGNAGKKSGISFFSDDVPRYKGFAFGVFGTNPHKKGSPRAGSRLAVVGYVSLLMR